jgi:hypothetical protein
MVRISSTHTHAPSSTRAVCFSPAGCMLQAPLRAPGPGGARTRTGERARRALWRLQRPLPSPGPRWSSAIAGQRAMRCGAGTRPRRQAGTAQRAALARVSTQEQQPATRPYLARGPPRTAPCTRHSTHRVAVGSAGAHRLVEPKAGADARLPVQRRHQPHLRGAGVCEAHVWGGGRQANEGGGVYDKGHSMHARTRQTASLDTARGLGGPAVDPTPCAPDGVDGTCTPMPAACAAATAASAPVSSAGGARRLGPAPPPPHCRCISAARNQGAAALLLLRKSGFQKLFYMVMC